MSPAVAPGAGGARKSRRAKRNNMRRGNSRNTARRMRGGMYKSVRFAVQLKNNQVTIDVVDVNALIRQDTQFYTSMFKEIINKIIQVGHIEERDMTDFQIRHIEGNAFELTFDFLYQGINAQPLLDLYIENIKEAFNKLTVFFGDNKYDVVATFR